MKLSTLQTFHEGKKKGKENIEERKEKERKRDILSERERERGGEGKER